jgi:hypothetical protein
MPGCTAAKHRIHVGVVDGPFGARSLSIVAVSQRALVNLVLVEVPQERLDLGCNSLPMVGNSATSMTDKHIPAILKSLVVRGRILFSNTLGVGMEDSDNDIFRRLEGFRVLANNVQEELAARSAVSDQGIEFWIAGYAVPPEIAPLVAFKGILATQIGTGRFLPVVPQGW